MAEQRTFENIALYSGGLAPRTFAFSIPEEGEIFRDSAGPNFGIWMRKGNKIYQLSPEKQTAYPGQKFNPSDTKIHPFISKELGSDVKQLPEYNLSLCDTPLGISLMLFIVNLIMYSVTFSLYSSSDNEKFPIIFIYPPLCPGVLKIFRVRKIFS